MSRLMQRVAFLFFVVGVFWFGRESTHGMSAFWKHWWCPLPILMVAVGAASWFVVGRRLRIGHS